VLAVHEPVCHTRQQATVLFVVQLNTLECTEFRDIIKSRIQNHYLNEDGCKFFATRETNNSSGNFLPTFRKTYHGEVQPISDLPQ
jgi:hypothetical protein